MAVTSRNLVLATACAILVVVAGCRSSKTIKFNNVDNARYQKMATDIEYPTFDACTAPKVTEAIEPRDLRSAAPTDFWDLHLEEAICLALQNTDVLKDVGGRVLTAPDGVSTIFDPAIREADPQFGPEGALSAFDAQLATNVFWRKNDQVFNNPIEGGAIQAQHEFQQDFASMGTEISKRAATGARFSIANTIDFDRNNANEANKLFPESWNSQLDFSLRQPLLRGGGSLFNRIAGPDAKPGFYSTTGVLLARINTDVSLADFDAAVIEYVSRVERAYWDLFFAYRDLDAAVLARNQSLETWKTVRAKYENNLRGGEAYQEARARAQYFLFQDQVQDALNGVRAGSAIASGRSVGVYAGERRLRWLMGLPTTGDQMIRPLDEPSTAKISFDWDSSVQEALVERVELRRQRWQVKRYELQLVAARNFVLPRLDALAVYRVRGFGEKLVGDSFFANEPEQTRFSSAFKDLGTWDHQEWETGMQLEVPLGFRQGWAGVRQSELQLARARAILDEQESLVTLELSDAFAETTRAHAAVQANFDRLTAAQQERLATRTAYEADQVTVDILLESQQRLAESQRQYFASLTNYALSQMALQVSKGTLLPYDGIYLSEGAWPRKAYRDAAEVTRRWKPKRCSCAKMMPGPVSAGHFEAELPAGCPVDATPQILDEPKFPAELMPAPEEATPGQTSIQFPLSIATSDSARNPAQPSTDASATAVTAAKAAEPVRLPATDP